MKTQPYTNHQIDAILSSTDGMSRAEVSPFFYARLEARLEHLAQARPSVWVKVLQLFTQPAVAFGILSIFLVMNIMAIRVLTRSTVSNHTSPNSALANFATEYNLNNTGVYANNNN